MLTWSPGLKSCGLNPGTVLKGGPDGWKQQEKAKHADQSGQYGSGQINPGSNGSVVCPNGLSGCPSGFVRSGAGRRAKRMMYESALYRKRMDADGADADADARGGKGLWSWEWAGGLDMGALAGWQEGAHRRKKAVRESGALARG